MAELNSISSGSKFSLLNAYWRAANYLSVGQIYLYDNPLLKTPLTTDDIKPRLLGHWGTTPGLNFIYAHLNRLINNHDLNMIFVTGPGHGGPAVVANTYLEGSYSEFYPDITQDEQGMAKLFKQFSFPGGIPSHASAQTPGSINEGGELGYALLHAYGAVFDNPGLIACCVVGDGEAETGPLAASWHSNKFLNPQTDGVVLPVLHLNGYKIANPTLLSRISREELQSLFEGYGYTPYFVEGDDPEAMHQLMADTLDKVIEDIHDIKSRASKQQSPERPRWPMVILRSPKGWTGPVEVDGKPNTGTFHAHQVPFSDMEKPEHLRLLQEWLLSYAPNELFDESGQLKPELRALSPKGKHRMGSNPHANGGLLLQPLQLPDFHHFAFEVAQPGEHKASAMGEMGKYLAEVMRLNAHRFRVFSPDENNSNRLNALFEVTQRQWVADRLESDEDLAPYGGVMEILSEHCCEGWLEGYLLTGRHGLFTCYEAFIHIVDSMVNQYAKWLKECRDIAWRKPIASLNIVLTSHVWRQDHNGFSHQDPGFMDHVANKKAEIIRIYLPADANTLIVVTDHCLRSNDLINVIVAGKQKQEQWLDMDEAEQHAKQGISVWEWASNDEGSPDVVIASAGDIPVLESLAAVSLLRELAPQLKIRYINVVDLMALQPDDIHAHGLSDEAFDRMFTRDKPIIFAFHGYPGLIHRMAYRRHNHGNLHVHGYQEEGTTTTPFDMVVLNKLDRFHLIKNVLKRVENLENAEHVLAIVDEKLIQHKRYIEQHGEDMPEIQDWKWQVPAS
ncbi:phosphoketolase family protein [Methylobacillus caricis]|uniref:phosphoketolase family protein n=1 Tax=Methylobacillus caricis TaxID=1971611 RepID=UPI001CFF6C1A|nr:phosphoketolase family protein [Methylobacillus caricis]MCB5187344.1 phosphoketolase family protein [Methylobacillus caricis]